MSRNLIRGGSEPACLQIHEHLSLGASPAKLPPVSWPVSCCSACGGTGSPWSAKATNFCPQGREESTSPESLGRGVAA